MNQSRVKCKQRIVRFPRAVEFARLRGRSYTHVYRCLMGERSGPLATEYHEWMAAQRAINHKLTTRAAS